MKRRFLSSGIYRRAKVVTNRRYSPMTAPCVSAAPRDHEYCRDFFGIGTIAVVPAIQAFSYFSEYLVARGRLDGAQAAQLQGFAERDFENILKRAGADSAPYRIYPIYAALIGGTDWRSSQRVGWGSV